jgi:hypothetical protein
MKERKMNGKNQLKIAMMMLLATAVVLVVQAQTGDAAAPAAKAGGKSLWELWKVGGPVMWPIGLCSVAGIGLAVYCGLQYRIEKMARPDIQAALRKAIGALDFRTANSLCAGAPCMLTSVLAAGLARLDQTGETDTASFEKAMEEASGNKAMITIMAEGDTAHQRVIDIMNACAAAKLKDVSFAGTAE